MFKLKEPHVLISSRVNTVWLCFSGSLCMCRAINHKLCVWVYIQIPLKNDEDVFIKLYNFLSLVNKITIINTTQIIQRIQKRKIHFIFKAFNWSIGDNRIIIDDWNWNFFNIIIISHWTYTNMFSVLFFSFLGFLWNPFILLFSCLEFLLHCDMLGVEMGLKRKRNEN